MAFLWFINLNFPRTRTLLSKLFILMPAHNKVKKTHDFSSFFVYILISMG